LLLKNELVMLAVGDDGGSCSGSGRVYSDMLARACEEKVILRV